MVEVDEADAFDALDALDVVDAVDAVDATDEVMAAVLTPGFAITGGTAEADAVVATEVALPVVPSPVVPSDNVATEKKPAPPPEITVSLWISRVCYYNLTYIHWIADTWRVALRVLHFVTCCWQCIAAVALSAVGGSHDSLAVVLALDGAIASRLVDVGALAGERARRAVAALMGHRLRSHDAEEWE